MKKIISLLKSSATTQNLRNNLICSLAQQWPNEYEKLCQPMKYSPSVLHSLINAKEDDLPSSILLNNELLLDEKGKIQAKQNYDRKAFVELNRGMSSAISLLYILRGDCYVALVEGQKKEITLSKESYLKLHNEFRNLLLINDTWDEQLLDALFYAVLFNDLGKNIELKRTLNDVYQINENDHDLILKHAFQIDGLLKDFHKFSSSQQNFLRAMWQSGFNPSSFDTLEYPLSMVTHWVMSFANVAKEHASIYLAMKKVEILTDIAGVNGNNSLGAINLTEPVVEKFNRTFAILSQLFMVYKQQIDSNEIDQHIIYKAIEKKLVALLFEHAKFLGITSKDEFTPDTTFILRLCKMLGISDKTQTNMVVSLLKQMKQRDSDLYQRLEQEFSWAQENKPVLWLECIPKFIWLMSNGNNYDLIANNSLKNSVERRENGLYASLMIVSNIIKKIRDNNKYEEIYTFEDHELTKMSPNKSKMIDPSSIALFVAYDLVRIAQQASELNSDLKSKQDAVNCLKDLWKNGVLIEGRSIVVNRTSEIKDTPKTLLFFDKYQMNNEQVGKFQQEWLDQISKETKEHCIYLESIGLADRAHYFKVKPYIYQDVISKMVDISRFSQCMDLPDVVSEFDIDEKHTLFTNSESNEKEQLQKEIKNVLDIRLYPTIRKLIKEKGASVFLGSKAGLQSYAESVKEKVILEIEVPSSVKFFISLNNIGDIKVYISNLVSHENLIQQLMTLKLAGIEPKKIPILGNTQQFKLICKDDLLAFEKQASSYLTKKNVLIVAGCSLEETVCSTLEQVFSGKITKNKFYGSLVSLTYIQSQNAPSLGFIVLDLNYGEICEEQISIILKQFNCIGIFSGSAAGCITQESQGILPEIGDRVSVHSAKHHTGEVVTINEKSSGLHLHVPTIFVETFSWLNNAKKAGVSTVDVETFYILRAIQKYQKENPLSKILTDIGVFISDYVGTKPLRSYNDVFSKYPSVLQNFIDKVLVANITNSYNNNRLSIPTFSSQYVTLTPEMIMIDEDIKKEAVIDSIGKKWDKSEFSKRVHAPVTIGKVKDQESFVSKTAPRCIHLPIKLPGSDIRIPEEYQHFLDILQQIFDFEASINSGWKDLYAYLTVDIGFVPRSKSQRVPGSHVDGIPRDRENPGEQLIDHAYLVTNAIPTMFYMQQFDMNSYDPKIHHFFAIMRALSDESRTITVKPFEIGLMNAYSVHTPTETLQDVSRVFVRLEFSTLKFDRIGNSINPYFENDENYKEYPFHYVPRPIPQNLFVPPEVYLNKPITNEDFSYELIECFGRADLKAFFVNDERYKLKRSDYKDLNLIAKDIMDEKKQGMVFCHQGIPHAFCLYDIENKTIKLDSLYTLMNGKGQEMLIYGLKVLQKLADKLSLQAGLKEGAIPITIVVTDNNEGMLKYFLRAARLAKIEVNIERPTPELSSQDKLTVKMYI